MLDGDGVSSAGLGSAQCRFGAVGDRLHRIAGAIGRDADAHGGVEDASLGVANRPLRRPDLLAGVHRWRSDFETLLKDYEGEELAA